MCYIYSEESKLSDECFIKAIGRVNNIQDDYYSVPNFIIDIVYDHTITLSEVKSTNPQYYVQKPCTNM